MHACAFVGRVGVILTLTYLYGFSRFVVLVSRQISLCHRGTRMGAWHCLTRWRGIVFRPSGQVGEQYHPSLPAPMSHRQGWAHNDVLPSRFTIAFSSRPLPPSAPNPSIPLPSAIARSATTSKPPPEPSPYEQPMLRTNHEAGRLLNG